MAERKGWEFLLRISWNWGGSLVGSQSHPSAGREVDKDRLSGGWGEKRKQAMEGARKKEILAERETGEIEIPMLVNYYIDFYWDFDYLFAFSTKEHLHPK